MKSLSLVGKINVVLGMLFFLSGIVLLMFEQSGGFALKNLSVSISFLLIGITIFLSAAFYRKEEN